MGRDKSYFARKKDANHIEIVDALNRAGYAAYDTHKQGFGFPDILVVGKNKLTVLFEIKLSGEKLTEQEDKFRLRYAGFLHTVTSAEDAIKWMDYYSEFQLEYKNGR